MARRARKSLSAKAAIAPQAMAPSHDAAGAGRRLRAWVPASSGPNRANSGAPNIRNRARDVGRNDWAGRAIPTRWSANLVGTGIIARPKTENAALKAILVELWDEFMIECDADGVLDGYGLQNMVARNWIEAGEVFVRLRSRLPQDGLAVPLQIQVLECDMVPMLDSIAPNGNEIWSGIEFDRLGRRVAYWMYRNHPGDGRGNTGDYARVPAEYVLHIYEPTRPGQLRGISDLAPILAKLRSAGNFDDAVLFRQEIANLFVGFVERPASAGNAAIDPLTGGAVATDSSNMPMAALEPGTMQETGPGETVKFSAPPDAGANYGDFSRTQNQYIAAGTGLPYELLTGDLRDVSDRALRVILNEFRRHCQQRQWHILIPQLCRKIRNAWADAAVISGVLTAAEGREARRVTWVPQGWAYIHPTQDVQAKKMEIEAGLNSRSHHITERGDDPDEIDRERAADDAREERLGLRHEEGTPPANAAGQGVANAMLESQRSLGNAIAQLAAREQPAPQLTVQMPAPGKPTMKVGKRLPDGSIEVREIDIEAGA